MFRPRRLAAALTVMAVAMAVIVADTGTFARNASALDPDGARSVAEQPVTLITGDRVFVQTRPSAPPLLRLEPGAGRRRIQFFQYVSREHAYVLPSDAAPLVASGRLDRRLFDVTVLLANGYGDLHRSEIPLLMRYSSAAAARSDVPGLKTLMRYRYQPLAAAKTDKKQAVSAWRALTAAAGVQRVWLDAKAALSLDQSVPHIGAPQAWQRGLDGSGVKVAVLDSGYDPSHPDLAGAVIASRNFTNDPDGVTDTIGHGTHVASTVAGRGGQYRGVAPGAELLIGKVCALTETSPSGQCPESAILAGMEWAAEQGARVVNLSLGGAPTDGTDPVSAAVNDLTARYGTLFVAAAGNHYPWQPGEQAVSTPAAADAALAVASLTRDDRLSEFSNAGPRVGDFALKPDLAAPGQDIVAARAAQGYLGEPVGDRHTRMSGTSMASPHVAGAAAILAGAHPKWRATELKAALLSTAKPVAGVSVYARGTGLVDVDRATSQPVHAEPGTLSMGYFKWPNASPPPSSKPVTYHNDSAGAVTLALQATSDVTGMFNVDANTVSIPAHGSATVNVTVTAQPRHLGLHSGELVARSADGATIVRTTLGAFQEPESYDLRIATLDRAGARPGEHQPNVIVTNLDTGAVEQPVTSAGAATLRLPRGRYAVWAGILTGPTDRDEPSATVAAEPEVSLTQDVTVNFDARDARPVRAAVDRAGAESNGTETVGIFQTVAGETRTASASTLPSAKVFLLPTARDVAGLGYFGTQTLMEPEIRLAVKHPQHYAVPVSYVDPVYTPHFVGDETLVAVDGSKGTKESLSKIDVKGRLVLLTLDGPGEIDALSERVRNVAVAGGKAVQLTTWHSPNVDGPLALPTMLTDSPAGQRLLEAARAGEVKVRLQGIAASPYQYNLVLSGQKRIPVDPTIRVRDRDLAAVTTQYAAQAVRESLATVGVGPVMSGWVSPVYLTLPMQRVEYFSPGNTPGTQEPLRWHFDFRNRTTYDGSGPWGGWQMGYRGPYRAGRYTERLNAGPFGPAVADLARVSWQEPYLLVEIPLYSDGAAGHFGPAIPFFGEDSGTMILRRDGIEIGRSAEPGSGMFELGQLTPGRYQIEVDAARSAPWTTLNSRLRAQWSFTWSDIEKDPPLTAVRFTAPLDQYNRAPAGARFPLTLRVEPVSVQRLGLDVSYDDGATWTVVTPARKGGQWTAWLDHPRDARYVSVRTTATDAGGNTVTQETIRAYALR